MTRRTPGAAGRPSSRGFTLIEITVAVILLAIVMTLTVRMLGWIASERRASERRQWALREAANVMERVTARPWDRISPEAAKTFALSEQAGKGLPDGALTVTVDGPDAAGSKRIVVRIRWKNRAGDWDAPVRLTAWVHRAGRPPR